MLADDQFTVGLFSPLTDELCALPGFQGSLNVVGTGVLCGLLMPLGAVTVCSCTCMHAILTYACVILSC